MDKKYINTQNYSDKGNIEESVVCNGCLQLIPGVHKSDGFFIAKFKKVNHE